MLHIINKLKKIRLARGLSQSALSREIGVAQSYVSKLESGNLDPRLSSLEKLGLTLGAELVLVPREYVSAVQAIIDGQTTSEPMWQPDESEYDDD